VAPPIVRFDSGSTLSLAETKRKVVDEGLQYRVTSWFLASAISQSTHASTRLSSSVHWRGECLIIIAGIDSEGLIW
jgi:hypothetical protein